MGDKYRFSVDSAYDASQRRELDAVLQVANARVYFYVEETWWNSQRLEDRPQIQSFLIDLATEFEQRIYPTITETFGSEWNPGIDRNPVITVLFHDMRDGAGGYTNYGDEYSRVQVPSSNEREMVYLSVKAMRGPFLKSFLAHEFTHLVTFNQKDIVRKVSEEVWLNEVRAEYAPTLMGYDANYEDSNLKQRVKSFLEKPSNALTEWENKAYDYGIADLFAQYLVDQYGREILVDSLKSSLVGIASLNEVLQKKAFKEDFSQVFVNWVIALFLNDCTYGSRYCYHNPHLVNFRVIPQTNFFPSIGENMLVLNHVTQDWVGNWYKIVGGKDTLKVEFKGDSIGVFKVPYIIEDEQRKFSVQFLSLDKENRGELFIPKFNSEIRSVVLLPVSQKKLQALDEEYSSYQFSLSISTTKRSPQEEEALISQLLLQIESLKKKIVALQAELARMLGSQGGAFCTQFTKDLFFGLKDDSEVRCLQELLKSKEPALYPEGLVSGNFFTLTQAAMVRFQEKYRIEVLAPAGF
ncbi:MAG: hypothetical protein Q7S63_02750, partial [bacterium]|nr:hypothetical protein [bacterium]